MIKLQTRVEPAPSPVKVSLEDKVTVLGSCFADEMGEKMRHAGFDVCVNPFGTLYNPVSISGAVERLECGDAFREGDCVEMGAGAGLICSFHHHTSFARRNGADFLEAANASLTLAHDFWKSCNKVIITLGTVFCFKHIQTGMVVSNCLKRPAGEFLRFALDIDGCVRTLKKMTESFPDKEFLFTVSPIRHMADGAHGNQLSKSTLLLSVESILGPKCAYFPAYELLLDELRDYRFYAEDMVHPSSVAVEYIWERFLESCVPQTQKEVIRMNEKAFRSSQHRPIHL